MALLFLIVGHPEVFGAPNRAPSITTNPANATKCPGDSVTFSVTASGTAPLSYQWRKAGSAIAGATNTTYTIPSVSSSSAGSYDVVVSNSAGKATSSAATLTVNVPASAGALTNLTRSVGANAVFSTTASGTGPYSYMWDKNGVTIAGQTNSSLVLTNLSPADSGVYRVMVSGTCGSGSASATLTVATCFPSVDVMLVIDRSGSMAGQKYNDARQACSNFVQYLNFAAGADQAGLASYNTNATVDETLTNSIQALDQAIHSIPAASGNTSISLGLKTAQGELASSRHNPQGLPVLLLLSDGLPTGTDTKSNALYTATQAKNAGTHIFTIGLGSDVDPVLMAGIAASPSDYFFATNSSQLGNLFNAIATLICRPPTNIFINGLSNVTVCPGSTAIFAAKVSATTSGCTPYGYQWEKDGVRLPGETNSSLVINNVSTTDAGVYAVEVTSVCRQATNSAILTVNVPLQTVSGPANSTNCTGSSASFSVAATGTSLSYQWYKSASPLAARTNSSMTLNGLSATDAGTYSVVVNDLCGNTTSNSASLTVTDLPVIACGNDKTVEGGTTWTFDTPAANYPIVVVGTVTNPLDQCTFTATQTWQATDACGNPAQCSQTVTVVDTTAPVISCPSNVVAVADAGQCSKSNVTFMVTANDNCGSVSVVSVPASGSTFPVGTTVVTNTASDGHGNSSVCMFSVTVSDNQAPVISCPSNVVAVADAGQCSKSNVTFVVMANDNCGSVSVVSVPASGSTFPVGTTIVTNTATDGHGNSSVCTFSVTVSDSQAPVISCPSNKSVQLGQTWTFDQPAAWDNCDSLNVEVTGTITNATCGNSFIATRTWRASDSSGNSAECSQSVSVLDSTAPSVSIISPTNGTSFLAPADIQVQASVQDSNGIVVKVEFFVGTITNKIGEATNGTPYSIDWTGVPSGSYTLIARATSACGIMATSAPVNITVLESVPLTVSSPIRLNYQSGYYEESVRVYNPTPFALEAVGIVVSNLPTAWRVQNASLTIGGVPIVLYNQPLASGSSVTMTIQYYLGVGASTTNSPTLVAIEISGGGTSGAAGTSVTILRGLMLQAGTFLLNFNTDTNATYYVQYSGDLRNWKTSSQTVTGTGYAVQWVDYGPPATESSPTNSPARFYRVFRLH